MGVGAPYWLHVSSRVETFRACLDWEASALGAGAALSLRPEDVCGLVGLAEAEHADTVKVLEALLQPRHRRNLLTQRARTLVSVEVRIATVCLRLRWVCRDVCECSDQRGQCRQCRQCG
eukprot:4476776-Pleurochrysis_carterae.AAC.2